jgi:hypothetical protein
VTGPTGLAWRRNQVINAPININNPVGQDHLRNMMATAQQAQVPRAYGKASGHYPDNRKSRPANPDVPQLNPGRLALVS